LIKAENVNFVEKKPLKSDIFPKMTSVKRIAFENGNPMAFFWGFFTG